MAIAPIQSVSETARWVATYRAMESERPDALFHDPFARSLAGDRGVELVRGLPGARGSAWAMIVRTAVMDEIILRLVKGGTRLVLNLAAGLDARPYRLELPGDLHWVDVDLPAILEYKRQTLEGARARCRYEAVPLDLTDETARRELFARLGAGATDALVIAEGLLVYLADEQVAGLARDLHARPGLRWWLIDLASPRLLKYMRRYGRRGQIDSAVFRFAPAEGTAFFEPCGWRQAEYRSTFEEAGRLHRRPWWMKLFSWQQRFSARAREDARRMAGVVLLEREERTS
jgi:methyltransferase (TIGR00027 family)